MRMWLYQSIHLTFNLAHIGENISEDTAALPSSGAGNCNAWYRFLEGQYSSCQTTLLDLHYNVTGLQCYWLLLQSHLPSAMKTYPNSG